MKTYYKGILACMTLCIMLLLSACGVKPASDAQLREALENGMLMEGEVLDEIEIKERNTDKKTGADRISCTVQTHDDTKSYKKDLIISFYLPEKAKEWEVDNINVADSSTWEVMPLSGVKTDSVKGRLHGHSVMVDGEDWLITESNLNEAKIISQETDLENKTDVVTVAFSVDDMVERLTGEMSLKYVFDNNDWQFSEIQAVDNISKSTKPGMEFEVSNDDLIFVLMSQKLDNGNIKATVKEEEIRDFKVTGPKNTERGTVRTYDCQFDIERKLITVAVTATIEYRYRQDEGWKESIIAQTLKVTSLELAGRWEGMGLYADYHDAPMNLELTKKDNGYYEGVFEFYDKYGTKEMASYSVTGKFDQNKLTFSLIPGDWITKPKNTYNKRATLSLGLNSESNTLSGWWGTESQITVYYVDQDENQTATTDADEEASNESEEEADEN